MLACARGSPSPRFALNTNAERWRELNRLKDRTKDLPWREKRQKRPKKTPSETPPATRYPIKTCTCTIFLKIGSYFRSQGRFRPRAYFLLVPRSFPGECFMVARLTTSTPTEMRPLLRDHHGSLAFPLFLRQLFNAPHLMMRLCRFPAASSCVP